MGSGFAQSPSSTQAMHKPLPESQTGVGSEQSESEVQPVGVQVFVGCVAHVAAGAVGVAETLDADLAAGLTDWCAALSSGCRLCTPSRGLRWCRRPVSGRSSRSRLCSP